MFLGSGAKLLVCHRRLFSEDTPRFFVGEVTTAQEGLAKVSGFSWTRDPAHGFRRKEDLRTKIVPLGSGSVLVYELPMEVVVGDLRVEQPGGQSVVLTDGNGFSMDLAERMPGV